MAGQIDRDNQEEAAAKYQAAEYRAEEQVPPSEPDVLAVMAEMNEQAAEIADEHTEAIAANALRQSQSETQIREDDQLYKYFLMILGEDYDPTKFSADFAVVVQIMLREGLNRESIYTYLEELAVKNNLDWTKIRNAIELQMEIIEKIQTIEREYRTSVERTLLKAVNDLKTMLARGELPGEMSVRAEAYNLIDESLRIQLELMDNI